MRVVDTVEWACVLCGHHIQNDWVSRVLNFALSLNIPPRKLFRLFRRPQLWATGDWQLHLDNVPAHASHLLQFFGETSNHPGDSDPLQARFGALWLLAFPKTKITFEREEISDHRSDSRKYDGTADGDWKNCVRSQGAYTLRGTEVSLSYVQCFLYLLVSSSINVSIFHITWLDTFRTDLIFIYLFMCVFIYFTLWPSSPISPTPTPHLWQPPLYFLYLWACLIFFKI